MTTTTQRITEEEFELLVYYRDLKQTDRKLLQILASRLVAGRSARLKLRVAEQFIEKEGYSVA